MNLYKLYKKKPFYFVLTIILFLFLLFILYKSYNLFDTVENFTLDNFDSDVFTIHNIVDNQYRVYIKNNNEYLKFDEESKELLPITDGEVPTNFIIGNAEVLGDFFVSNDSDIVHSRIKLLGNDLYIFVSGEYYIKIDYYRLNEIDERINTIINTQDISLITSFEIGSKVFTFGDDIEEIL